MNDPLEQLEKDFTERPRWIQDAACRLLANGSLSLQDMDELTLLCKAEAGISQPDVRSIPEFQRMPPRSLRLTDPRASVRLESVGSLKGVNALAPKKPLEFSNKPLCVVFGSNGSGKSGYVRVLKQLCGCRGAVLPYGNVFDDCPAEPSCEVQYTLDGACKGPSVCKLKSGSVTDLAGVSIYDTACAEIYVNEKSEVTYEPPLLRLLRRLVEICDTVRMRLSAEIAAMSSALPMLPSEYAATEAGRWYSQLTHATTEAAIDAKCDWQLRDDAALDVIARRVSETSPADKAKDLRKIKDRGLELATRLRTDREALGDAAFEALKQARRDADAKRRAVAEDAKKVFDNALDGVATESWRLLWSAARSYSEQEAYKGEPFPYLGQQARCVLCQQALGASGSARMAEFERFVEGALEASAASAERSFRDALEKLPAIPSETQTAEDLERAGVNDVSLTKEVNIFYRQLAGRKEIFVSVLDKEKLPLLPVSVADKLESLSAKLEADAAALDQDAQEGQRAILRNQLREDKARQWLSQQRPAVLAEVRRLGRQRLLEIAQRLANTKWLSDTKSALAEVIVSQPFIDRFQQELKALRASRIRVAVERTKTTKAQVFHQIKIVGGKTPITTAQVLSEGEFRIVSLAAFLADVESRSSCSTFIFDDPVSSLDQEFEEATARRLVTLAKDRQVIVFTHRFSMLAYLESAAEEVGVDSSVITLRRETWGLGEPDGTGQDRHKNPDKAVNALRNERLSKARKIREEHGQGAYENEAKAICSDLRITLERLVEKVLLGGVVERFRGEVTTKNKLMSLAKINAEDCALIDRLMTKYSFQEHSQPDDRPVPVPDPDEIEGDLRAVASWYQEFKHRSPGDAQKMACPRGLVGGCRDEHP